MNSFKFIDYFRIDSIVNKFPRFLTQRMHQPKIYIALPILNEFENLPELINCFKAQTQQNFEVVVCVNQYESWWDLSGKIALCEDNKKSIDYLRTLKDSRIKLIDKSSKGLGWPDKRGGVGWARKIAMDYINKIADPNELILSIDADTYYPPDYIESIQKSFDTSPEITGLCIPYYHKLVGNETDTLILHYEIYMRNYLLNMLRINNPYAFTALGSAMAAPVWAYRKIGGITPVKSGEDFYFLQKLAKNGKIGIWTNTIAFPSPRFSDRVLFGTGPALIKGSAGDWDSYPLYNAKMFDIVKDTYCRFPRLFIKDESTPMDEFLMSQFKTDDIWSPLRSNYKDQSNFIKACITKVDGLRILQFLKYLNNKTHNGQIQTEVQNFDTTSRSSTNAIDTKDIKHLGIDELTEIRDKLFNKETILRQKIKYVGL